jgi:hypothetical protein
LLLVQLTRRIPPRPNSRPASPSSSCSRCQVGPDRHPLPQAAPELDSKSDRAAHLRQPRPWPWAHKSRSVSASYKAVATSYLSLFSLPASFNAAAFKP